MVAVKAHDVEGALRRRSHDTDVLLFYGPDAGLAAERARAAAAGAVDDPADPFQLVRLDGDALAADPARLMDEAGTIGLFGGRRAIWVRPTTRNLAPALDPLLKAPPLRDALVVIEAPDLSRSSPLRTLCERSPRALALPCYADRDQVLGELIDRTLREAGLSIDREARAFLLASLGGDRLATRAELAKLALYAHGQREVTVGDIEVSISDVSGLALDSVVDAAFAGQRGPADAGIRRAVAEGTSPAAILGAALRHGIALLAARVELESGKSAASVAAAWRGLHFSRKPAVEAHLRVWPTAALRRAIARLQADALETRRSPAMGEAAVSRALLDIAGAVSARSARG
jgi:DNA polymerase-3 subunit delta